MKCPKCGGDNSDEAVFCSLCYTPFPKKEKEALPNEPTPASPNPAPANPRLERARVSRAPVSHVSEAEAGGAGLLKLLMVVVVVAGGYFAYKNFMPSSSVSSYIDETPIVVPDSVIGKMEVADKLLEEQEIALEKFFSELENGKPNIKDFAVRGRHSKMFTKITRVQIDKLNALKLPCPTTPAAHEEPGYIEWSRGYESRDHALMNKANQRFKAIVDKTAREAYPSK